MDQEPDAVKRQNATEMADKDPAKIAKDMGSKKSLNLLKHSKHDLLRLLSILEGELEARDIFISTLQAQISNQRNARQQYFVHRLNDPFLALHRDDYSVGEGRNQNSAKEHQNNTACIEPLPLLEKVVYQFKTQQQKMHQQMSLASKIHRKMANELAEEKRKHAVDTKTGDDVTMALEKERERLKAGVQCEKARTRRIESEYRKLLELCRQDRKKHQMVVLMLLEERQRLKLQLSESKELQIDLNSSETELQAKLNKALMEKKDLAGRLLVQLAHQDELEEQIELLQEQIKNLKLSQKDVDATADYAYAENDVLMDDVPPQLPDKVSRTTFQGSTEDEVFEAAKSPGDRTLLNSPIIGPHHPMSVAQRSQDVTLIPTSSHPPILLAAGVTEVTTSGYYSVKPGSSIAGLEAMKSSAQNKEILNLEPLERGKDIVDGIREPTLLTRTADSLTLNLKPQPPCPPSGPPKPNRFVPGSAQYPPLRSPQSLFMERNQLQITSSPTSGAANFAMNSPNSPNPPQNSPFAVTRSPTVKARSSPMTPTKGPHRKDAPASNPKITRSTQFQLARQKFQNPTFQSGKKEPESKKSTKENAEDKKFQVKKITTANYKSLTTQKVSSVTASLPTVGKPKTDSHSNTSEPEKMKPLPPKTRPSTAPSNASDPVRPPPLPPKKPSLSSEKSPKCIDAKKPDVPSQRKPSSVKRPTPPTPPSKHDVDSTSSSSNGKKIKGPVPPSLPMKMSSHQSASSVTASPRAPLSAQQRLFPPQGGASGQPLSPITQTTPKTPNVFFGK